MSKARIISFYLPQFYPTPENDEWWQKGFTEWINVARAKPLFNGHEQPKIPGELSFYDLRVPEVREQQALLAKEYGIEGFCYWHYWFAGRRLLDRVFSEVVETGKPNFPFCLCWANHNWWQKTWDPTKPDKLLIEQTYPGIDDYISHFNAMLPAFKDKRYIRVNDKLLFGIVAPLHFKDFAIFKKIWNEKAAENGLNGFHFFAYIPISNKISEVYNMGYDSVVYDGVIDMTNHENLCKHYLNALRNRVFQKPKIMSYDSYSALMISILNKYPDLKPSINPNFDHTPRSGNRGFLLYNSTPQKWGALCKKVFNICQNRESDNNLVFIKAWNEWGEGNYLEPDMKYGRSYLEELKKALDEM